MFVTDFISEYGKYRAIGEKAMAQVSEEGLNTIVAPGTNSIAMLVRHMSGNFISRFTDFLTTDGEKPTRDRDNEFDEGQWSRAEIETAWRKGWATLEAALDDLVEDDLQSEVTIRGKPLAVHDALCRSLAHQAMHVGQIVLLARLLADEEWKWISIPKGQSKQYNLDPTLERGPAR
jgi:uncharacterized damage-inducible protein DinB